MIKKAIACFCCISLLYAALIAFMPNCGAGTHQWQENQIRAQRFLYEETSDTVIVGTSLSARILPDSVPTVSFCAFSACVVEDGLRLILSKKETPRYVLIETNYLLRPSNGEIVRVNTQGPLPWLRRFIPLLREQNTPVSLVGRYCMQGALDPAEIINMERLEKSIESRLLEDNTHYLTTGQVKERIQVLLPLVYELEKRGTEIILFEMPMNERLMHIASNNQTREAVYRMFPKDRYIYLPNDTTMYLTNDGEHLDANGQRRYSHFLKEVLKFKLEK